MLPARLIWQFHSRRNSFPGVMKPTNLLNRHCSLLYVPSLSDPCTHIQSIRSVNICKWLQASLYVPLWFWFTDLAPATYFTTFQPIKVQFNTSHQPIEVNTERPENVSKAEIYPSWNGHQNSGNMNITCLLFMEGYNMIEHYVQALCRRRCSIIYASSCSRT